MSGKSAACPNRNRWTHCAWGRPPPDRGERWASSFRFASFSSDDRGPCRCGRARRPQIDGPSLNLVGLKPEFQETDLPKLRTLQRRDVIRRVGKKPFEIVVPENAAILRGLRGQR